MLMEDTIIGLPLAHIMVHVFLSERSLYTCLKSKFLQRFPGDSSRYPSLKASRVYDFSLTTLYKISIT